MADEQESKADQIRRLLSIGGLSKVEIARQVGCSRPYVHQVSKRFSAESQSLTNHEIREDLREIRTMLRRIAGESDDIIKTRLKAIK